MPNPGTIEGTHHLTFCVGGAQEDYDFHVRTLGLKSVKKTVLFDGEIPIYHLYYANRVGDASTILTSFPYRQAGWMGKRGTNQAKSINVAVPAASIGYWADRLKGAGVEAAADRALRHRAPGVRAPVWHPVPDRGGDGRRRGVSPTAAAMWPSEHAIRGAWGTTTSVREPDPMDQFLREAFNAEHLGSEGAHHQYRLTGSRPRPDPRARRGAGPPAGHMALRRGHNPPSRLRRRHLREPAAGEGLHRRPRLHRRLRRQGPRLLLQRLPAHAGRRAVRPSPTRPRRASRSTSPWTSSARTCASPRTGRTADPRSRARTDRHHRDRSTPSPAFAPLAGVASPDGHASPSGG